MKLFSAIPSVDNLAVILSVTVISMVIALAISLTLFGSLSYPVIVLIMIIYGLVSFKAKDQIAKKKYIQTVRQSEYSLWVIVGALCVGIFLFGNQFEYMSLWGDIGVYINAASHLRAGGTIPFSWVQPIMDLETNNSLALPSGMINPDDEGHWQFHALPTWPALMAFSHFPLDGRPVLALLYTVNLILFFTVTKDFVRDERASALATLLLGSLPVVWHQTLYATSEMLLLAIFLSTFVLISRLRNASFHLGTGLFAYGSVHIGILILSPVVGGVLFVIALLGKKNTRARLAWLSLACGLSALLAYQAALGLSLKYTEAITFSLFRGREYFAYIACLAPLLGMIPFVAEDMLSLQLSRLRRLFYWLSHNFNIFAKLILLVIAVVVVIQAYLLGWSDYYYPDTVSKLNSWSARTTYINRGVSSLYHLSIFNIFLATGGFGLIAFLLIPFTYKYSLRIKLLWSFSLVFIFVFGIYRVDITNNYYASRYFLPILVPCLLILSAVLFKYINTVRHFLIPTILIAFYFNSSLVGRGFFLGDSNFKNFLDKNINDNSEVVVYGSDWLKYAIYPRLIVMNVAHSISNNQADTFPDKSRYTKLYISDTNMVLGGIPECIQFIERRIPWQITYPTSLDFANRSVCVYKAKRNFRSTLDLGVNDWLINGKLNFAVLASEYSKTIKIEFHSLGWWAIQEPFIHQISNIKPRLSVCGNEFQLVSLSPTSIVFEGVISADVCKVSLQTETFIPAEMGESNDTRALGIDVYAVDMIYF